MTKLIVRDLGVLREGDLASILADYPKKSEVGHLLGGDASLGFGDRAVGGTTVGLDNYVVGGIYDISEEDVGDVFSFEFLWAILQVFVGHSPSYVTQMFYPYGLDEIYRRRMVAGVWQPWVKYVGVAV